MMRRLALGLFLLSLPAAAQQQPAPQPAQPAQQQAEQPPRFALVLATSTTAVASQQPVPACLISAREVSAALRNLGYRVTERMDPARGAADAAIAGFARDLRDATGSAVIAYVCGPVAGHANRPFLLPSSATLERDTDLISQGLLMRLLPDAMHRGQPSAALIVVDGFVPSRPGAAALATAFDTLAQTAEQNGIGMAVSLAEPRQGATPLSAALREELSEPTVRVASLVAGLRTRLPPGSLVAYGLPATAGLLAGSEPPPPPAATPAAPAPAAAAPAAPAMPDEAAMSEADRRRVQAALAQRGLYRGSADGLFGAGTRAAIRRFQAEIGADATGTLTSAQATRLVTTP